MITAERMIKQGYWLFRYRSYLPLAILVFAISCMWMQKGLYVTELLWLDVVCIAISCFGEFIRVVAVGYSADRTSGRNTKQQVADEINQSGIYSMVRHPLYIGNFFIWLGIALFSRSWWLVAIFILIYFIYYERIIMAEEDFLRSKFGDNYTLYAEKVTAVIPVFANYTANKYRFRIRKVIRQENSTLFAIILVFLILEKFQDFLASGKFISGPVWISIAVIFTAIYLIIRTIKKKTRWLHREQQEQKIQQRER